MIEESRGSDEILVVLEAGLQRLWWAFWFCWITLDPFSIVGVFLFSMRWDALLLSLLSSLFPSCSSTKDDPKWVHRAAWRLVFADFSVIGVVWI